MKTAFLHGASIRPDGSSNSLWTREVPARDSPLAWQTAGLSWTATGYGARIPSRTMVRFNGRWRRVYVRIYSNAGTAYIDAPAGERITVSEGADR